MVAVAERTARAVRLRGSDGGGERSGDVTACRGESHRWLHGLSWLSPPHYRPCAPRIVVGGAWPDAGFGVLTLCGSRVADHRTRLGVLLAWSHGTAVAVSAQTCERVGR